MGEKFHALGDQVYINAENGKESNNTLGIRPISLGQQIKRPNGPLYHCGAERLC